MGMLLCSHSLNSVLKLGSGNAPLSCGKMRGYCSMQHLPEFLLTPVYAMEKVSPYVGSLCSISPSVRSRSETDEGAERDKVFAKLGIEPRTCVYDPVP